MDNKTKDMIKGWVAMDGGNIEKTARWMAYTIKTGPIAECRAIIAEALN